VGGRRIVFAGVDDSHLRLDRYDLVAGPADPTADLRIGLAHSPEPRVLDRFAADGHDLLLCGHTHGGQLRVPFYGALVTNCGIDRDRVRWLHRWAEPSATHPHGTWLHVSAGLGTSPYAPYRFAADGHDLLLCGHTHGGQLRVPFYGALVTNCGIDRDRVRWLHRWAEPSATHPHGTWLHVSAGLGTSPYAPYRFACPPEATLLTLTARRT
jgi:predicted MPP superfamily phosphohydrolase